MNTQSIVIFFFKNVDNFIINPIKNQNSISNTQFQEYENLKKHYIKNYKNIFKFIDDSYMMIQYNKVNNINSLSKFIEGLKLYYKNNSFITKFLSKYSNLFLECMNSKQISKAITLITKEFLVQLLKTYNIYTTQHKDKNISELLMIEYKSRKNI